MLVAIVRVSAVLSEMVDEGKLADDDDGDGEGSCVVVVVVEVVVVGTIGDECCINE